METLTLDEAIETIRGLDKDIAIVVNEGPHAISLKHIFLDRVVAESDSGIQTNLTPHTSFDYIPNWDLRSFKGELSTVSIHVCEG